MAVREMSHSEIASGGGRLGAGRDRQGLLIPAKEMSLPRPYGTPEFVCRSAFPTLKRGANNHCAYGAAGDSRG